MPHPPSTHTCTLSHRHTHTDPVTFSSGFPPRVGGGLRPQAGQGTIKEAHEFGLRMKKLWPQVTERAAQADKAQWTTPALLPLLSLLPAQCQLPSKAAPLKLSFGFCSKKPQPGRGTPLRCRDTLPSALSSLWSRHSLTAPDSTIFSGPLAVSSGTHLLCAPRSFPALLSLSGGGRTGRQPAESPIPAHFP